jgi:molybdate/tungstate transport system permease protein
LLVALSLILILFIILPLAGIAGTVNPAYNNNGSISWLTVWHDILPSLSLSLQTATVSTIICAILGIPSAYFISRSKSVTLFNIFRVLMTFPLALPPLISGALLLNVYGKESILGMAAQQVGIQLTQSPIGIVLAQTYVISPFVILSSLAGFQRIDPNYEYASRILGKGMALTFLNISLPLAAKEIAAGLVLAWMRAIGEFGANVMMAYNPKTISVQLWENNAMGGLNLVIPGVVIVLIFSFISLIFWSWVTNQSIKRKEMIKRERNSNVFSNSGL